MKKSISFFFPETGKSVIATSRRLCIVLIFLVSAFPSISGTIWKGISPFQTSKGINSSEYPVSRWTEDQQYLPGQIRAFEENKGQYLNRLNKWKVMYACTYQGTTILFTPKGIIYSMPESVRKDRSEEVTRENDREESDRMEEEARNTKIVYREVAVEWEGADAGVSVSGQDPTSFYFCSPDAGNREKSLDHIPGFAKLVYRNLYPGIDVEFTFHSRQGIKYNITVHPGADISPFCMRYSGQKSLDLDLSGNIHLSTILGDIIDHAPSSTSSSGQAVASAFVKDGTDGMKFNLGAHDNQEALVIDPWVTTPMAGATFIPGDIGMDAANNTYVYGMDNSFGFNKLTYLQKYNSSGVLQWTYAFNEYNSSPTFQSDLAVDPSGTSYVAAPFTYTNSKGNQYAMVAVNQAGVRTYFYNNYGSNNIGETWNLAYSCNYATLIQAGCGVSAGNTTQISVMSPSNGTLGAQYADFNAGEVYAGTVAPNGFYYALQTDSLHTAGSNNNLICCKITGSTVSRVYQKHLDYSYEDFTSKSSPKSVGTNGVAAGCGYLYTSDGLYLDQRNLLTGALIRRVTIPAGTNNPSGNVNSGIAVDLTCGYVYAGTKNQVCIYDAGLNLTGSLAAPSGGIVFDVTLNNGIVSACGADASGAGFVMQYVAKTCASLAGITHTNASCGTSNGSATANPSFCVAPYSFLWTPGGQTTATASNLSPGTYTVQISTQNSCASVKDTVTIFSTSIGSAVSAVTNVSCNGTCAGSATFTPSGGTGPYSYSWSGTGGSTGTASGLCAGTYTCTITDKNGCSATPVVTIIQPAALGVTSAQSNSSCFGICTGSAQVTASGGTAPYSYSWSGSAGTTQKDTALCAGTYSCTVTDKKGCSVTQPFTITQPPALSVTSGKTDVQCFGACNGTAAVNVSGGSGAGTYVYSWLPSGGSGNAAGGLCAGNYTCIIRDAVGCSPVISPSFSILQPSAISLLISSTATGCGVLNGSTMVNVSGGTPGYSYSWVPGTGKNVAVVTGLGAGSYTVSVSDTNGCKNTAVVSVGVTSPPNATATVTASPLCYGSCTGAASVIPAGGVPPYLFSWSGTADTTQNASSLCAGTYTCVVTDSNHCTVSVPLTVTQPTRLAATDITSPSTCRLANGSMTVTATGGTAGSGYTYNWSPAPASSQMAATASGLSASNYTCIVSDSSGCRTLIADSVKNIGSAPVAVILNSSPLNSCKGDTVKLSGQGGGSYFWTPGNLSGDTLTVTTSGTYTLNVTNNCGTASDRVSLVFHDVADPVVSGNHNICQGGSGLLSVSLTSGGPYTYLWSPGGGTGPVMTAAVPGMYTVTVTNGCGASTALFQVNINQVSAGFTASDLSGTIPLPDTFTDQSSPNSTGWSWTYGDGGTANGKNGQHTYNTAGTYTCTLTVTDSSGCNSTASKVIVVNDVPSWITVPNIFTPNGDGVNDIFYINSKNISMVDCVILDRWGIELAHLTEPGQGWDGTTPAGVKVSDGTYYYILRAKGGDEKAYALTGFLMVLGR